MPNWKIHLEVGKRLNDIYKYDDFNLNKFLLGNVLPDINNGYLVENVSKIYDHNYTHYGERDFMHHLNFYNQYKDLIYDDPILLGYFTHLFTDYIWNKDFYSRCYKDRFIGNKSAEELKIIKQRDFKLYDTKYNNNKFNIEINNDLIEKINNIDRISVVENDILGALDFVNKNDNCNFNYIFYNESYLDNLLDKTIIKIKEFK